MVVVDTNGLAAAFRSGSGSSRTVIRTTDDDRCLVLAALAAASRWLKFFYRWRSNLRDEGDHHLAELAIAGGARAIVIYNIRDFRMQELLWPELAVLTPPEWLEKLK